MKTKTAKLTSLNPQKYPDIEIKFRVIDDMKAFVNYHFDQLEIKGEFPKKAKKTVPVEAKKGFIGEEVDTRPRVERDGNIYVIGETKSKVTIEGSMIVKNPDGEEYIVKPEAFAKKYKKTAQKGVYSPIAEPILYIVSEEDIVFTAPWGEEMFAVKGAVLNISNLDKIYAIQNEAFKKTYAPVQEEINILNQ